MAPDRSVRRDRRLVGPDRFGAGGGAARRRPAGAPARPASPGRTSRTGTPPDTGELDPGVLDGVAAVVNLCGAPVAGRQPVGGPISSSAAQQPHHPDRRARDGRRPSRRSRAGQRQFQSASTGTRDPARSTKPPAPVRDSCPDCVWTGAATARPRTPAPGWSASAPATCCRPPAACSGRCGRCSGSAWVPVRRRAPVPVLDQPGGPLRRCS